MLNTKHLSAYTPSNMDTETLEMIFVQRHKLLKQSVKWVEESLLTDKKNHVLFIGPRGSGKTHLITMIVRRIQASKKLNDPIVIWLGEDDVIMNLTSLALAIINKMVASYPAEFNKDCLKYAKGKSADDVADIIFDDIKKQAGDKTLLVVKENMSDVFYGLKDLGQKRLRAYLQENNHISILGASQKLFDGISSRDSAFWGFFDVHHLETLSVEGATQLISNIAKINEDDELVEFLKTARGNYRIRALHYLAGGNHRLYVELASFLTKSSLDDFVDAITQLADHLTPYFQERIRSLSPQQAGIIQKLCELSGAIQVKVIAESLFIDERAVASQLKELKNMGYVISHKRGRAAYYEIAEPLLRLSLEVKNNHGEPLKVIASLFRAWFSDDELHEQGKANTLLKAYSNAALSESSILDDLKKNMFEELFDSKTLRDTVERADELLCVPELSPLDKASVILKRGTNYFEHKDFTNAKNDFDVVINLEKIPHEIKDELKSHARIIRSIIFNAQGEKDEAFADLTHVIDKAVTTNELIARAMMLRRHYFKENKNYISWENELNNLLALEEIPSKHRNIALFELPEIFYLTLQIDKAHQFLSDAFMQGYKEADCYASNVDKTLISVVGLGATHWGKEIEFLLPLYAQHESLSKLSSGLIFTIKLFINDDTLKSSFKKWVELWQTSLSQNPKEYAELQLAVEVVNASAEALLAGNDKPLFALPKEIRELILQIFEDVFDTKA